MKVLILGLTGFGNAALRAAVGAGCEVVGVVTRKEPGPFPYYEEESLAAEASRLGVPVFEGQSFKDLAFCNQLIKLGSDILIAATYHEKIPSRLFKCGKKGLWNVHPSLLPAYRGPTPITWTLIGNDKETGVTVHELTNRQEEGDIVGQTRVHVGLTDTDGSLRQKLARTTQDLLGELLTQAQEDRVAKSPQDGNRITTFPIRSKRDAEISFDEPTLNVHNRVRATNPFPGAYFNWRGREYRILESMPAAGEHFEVAPGLVTGRNGNGSVTVKTLDGAIRLKVDPALPDEPILELARHDRPAVVIDVKSDVISHTTDQYDMARSAQEFPQMVVLAVAYPCNAKCPNCPYTEGNSDIRMRYFDAPFIDAKLFKKIADECGKFGSFIRITGGGEPMLHPDDMTSLIEYAKSVKAKVWLNTNGSCLPPAKADRLLACALDQIEFSVDAADKDTYDIVRAGLDFDKLVETVSYMVKKRNETGSKTNIVVSAINQDIVLGKMDDIAKFWLDLGVDEVIRRKFLTWGTNTQLDDAHTADERPYLDKTKGEPCPFPFHRLNIDSRGKIEVCGYDIAGRTNFGSVKDKTIEEIWKGPEFTWWRQLHLERRGGEIPLCRECPDWQFRSWSHNWHKVMGNASKHREQSTTYVSETEEVGAAVAVIRREARSLSENSSPGS